MKKVLRIVLASVLMAVTAFAFTACGSKTGTDNAAYWITHGHYVGRAVVTVDKDNKITDVEIDECELPYTWAAVTDSKIGAVDIAAGDFSEVQVKGRNNVTQYYAKKVKIGKLVFSLYVDGDELPYSGDAYVLDGTETSLSTYAILNGAWFWDNMSNGEYYILKADGTAYDVPFTKDAVEGVHEALKKGDRWFKSKNGYWPQGTTYPLGWKGNMEKIKALFIGTKGLGLGEIVDTNEAANAYLWKVGTVNTGATLSDFEDYFELVQLAYANAIR